MSEPKSATVLLHVTDPTTPAGGWIVRVVPPGCAYGKGDKLVNEGDQDLVEFFDPRHPHHRFDGVIMNADIYAGDDFAGSTYEGAASGQFVSRYDLDAFMSGTGGIDLYGGVDAWTIGAAAADTVRNAVREITFESRISRIEVRLANLGDDEVFDRLNDALHEAADNLNIPEGEGRDVWRMSRMEDFGIAGLEGDDLAKQAAKLMGTFEYQRGDLSALYPADPDADSPYPS